MEAAQGSIFVKYINPPAASNPNTANFINEFSQLNPSVGGADPGVWASWAFDSVYALAYALRNATANNLNPKDPNLLMKAIGETDIGFPRFGRHAFLLAMWLRFLAADWKVVLNNLP